MIDYIHLQLSIWGRWAVRRSTSGLGYPTVSPMFKDRIGPSQYNSCEPPGVTEYVHCTDQAVARLPAEDKRLCVEFYQIGGKATEIAQRMGIRRQRLYERLDGVHCAVLGHMNDIEAGC